MAINQEYIRRVATRDSRVETKNQAAADKKGAQKFNTGVDVQAVFGALNQLVQTFTSKVLDNTSVNMSLTLRTIYRNLDDKLVEMLTDEENVTKLNQQLEDKNSQVAAATGTVPTSTQATTSSTQAVKYNDVETERTETLEPIVEAEQVTERTETLPPIETESATSISLTNVTPTQKAFASGEVSDAEDVDVLQLAQDFINELQSNIMGLKEKSGPLATQLTERYDEFTDKIESDDEDEYEWNLYRYLYNQQHKAEEVRKEKLMELLKNRTAGGAPKAVEKESAKEEAKSSEPVEKETAKESPPTPEDIKPARTLPPRDEKGRFVKAGAHKEGGLGDAWKKVLEGFKKQALTRQRAVKLSPQQIMGASVSLATPQMTRWLMPKLRALPAKDVEKFLGKQAKVTQPSSFTERLRDVFAKRKVIEKVKEVKPTAVGRGITRVVNTVNTIRRLFVKPKRIAVMNNAIVFPLRTRIAYVPRRGIFTRLRSWLFGTGQRSDQDWKEEARYWKKSSQGWKRQSQSWQRIAMKYRRAAQQAQAQLGQQQAKAATEKAAIKAPTNAPSPKIPPAPAMSKPPTFPKMESKSGKDSVAGVTGGIASVAGGKGDKAPPKPPTVPTKVANVNAKLGAKPSAPVDGKAAIRSGKGMVQIPASQAKTIQGLGQKSKQHVQTANALSRVQPKPKTKGLGALARRKNVSDDEAFRRNINEGYSALMRALSDKNLSKIALPAAKIGHALSGFFGATTSMTKSINNDIGTVEKEINNPKKGLLSRIWSFIKKVIVGGLILIGGIALIRKFTGQLTSWLPRGADGKITHGPTLFGVRLPNFMDMFNMAKGIFVLVTSSIRRVFRSVKDGMAAFKRGTGITGFRKLIKWVTLFMGGVLWGKAMGALLDPTSIAPLFGKLAPVVWPILATVAQSPVWQEVTKAVKIGGMLIGMLWPTIASIFGLSEKSDDPMRKEMAKWGADKVNELLAENAQGPRAVNVLESKSKAIKPLVPIQNLLPDSMKATDAKGKTNIKALIPEMGFTKLGSGTVNSQQKEINKIADIRKKDLKDKAGDTGLESLNKAMSAAPEPKWRWVYGKRTDQKQRGAKFIELADKNIKQLRDARKKVGKDFDGPYWSSGWLYKKGKDPKRAWNPEWQYTGENAKLLQTIMPLEPFGDASSGATVNLATPWKNDVLGIVPLGVSIPGTGATYIVDMNRWQKERYNVGIAAWEYMRDWVRNHMEDYGSKTFKKKLAKRGQEWVEITSRPNSSARIRNARKEGMVDRWNEWAKKHKTKKEASLGRKILNKIKSLKDVKAAQVASAAGKAVGKAAKKTAAIFWKAVPGHQLAEKSFQVAVWGGKKIATASKAAAAAIKKAWANRFTHGSTYIVKHTALRQPWRTLRKQKATDEELQKAFGIDKWFKEVPPSDEKIYKKGVGKMFYNILLALGFKYEKAVWQNPQFMATRGKAMQVMAEAMNAYIANLVRPHGQYIQNLLNWSWKHRTKAEQDAVFAAAKAEIEGIDKIVSEDKFMEYVAKYYQPTDIHLVIRNKEGKIIKEEGKELRGFDIPKELYDMDPAYWDSIMNLVNESALPPESLLKLQVTRAKLMMAVLNLAKKSHTYILVLKKRQIQAFWAAKLAKIAMRRRIRLLTLETAKIKFRIFLAKKEIALYFKYRKFVEQGSIGAFLSFVLRGSIFNQLRKIKLGGEVLAGDNTFSHKMLGSIQEIIADRKKLIKRMRDIIQLAMARGEIVVREERESLASAVTNTLKGAANTVKSVAKGAAKYATSFIKDAKSHFKSFAKKAAKTAEGLWKDRDKLAKKAADTVKKATSANLNLFKMFAKEKADENDIQQQMDAMAKDMVPRDDKEGTARLNKLLDLVRERKDAAQRKKEEMRNKWRELRRSWQDHLSVESMTDLKAASARLSDNIFEYMGLVKDIPAGGTTVVNQSLQTQPSVIMLMPDLTF